MILTRVFPGTPEQLELDDPATRDRLLALYTPTDASWLRLNLVASVSGSAAGPDGTSETLTSRSDRRILGVIRELSDVVLVGAASVRAEGYQVPRRSRLAVVTASGDLSGHRLDEGDVSRVIVVCAVSAVDRVRETLGDADILAVDSSDGRIAAADLIAVLRSHGHASIVCEGGPGLAAQLVEAGLVDDVCLTTSPSIGEVRLPILSGDGLTDRATVLEHLIVDEASYVFAKWAIRSA